MMTLKETEEKCRQLAMEAYKMRHPEKFGNDLPKNESPSLGQMVQSAGGSLKKWVKGGMAKASQSVIEARLETCKGCELWDSQALKGTGRCKKCGCSTWAKIRMATERCPIGKWGAVDTPTN
jgi:hypothetical protein